MRVGYGRVSTRDQNPDGQRDALQAAGCDEIFIDQAKRHSQTSSASTRQMLSEAVDGTLIRWERALFAGQRPRPTMLVVGSRREERPSVETGLAGSGLHERLQNRGALVGVAAFKSVHAHNLGFDRHPKMVLC